MIDLSVGSAFPIWLLLRWFFSFEYFCLYLFCLVWMMNSFRLLRVCFVPFFPLPRRRERGPLRWQPFCLFYYIHLLLLKRSWAFDSLTLRLCVSTSGSWLCICFSSLWLNIHSLNWLDEITSAAANHTMRWTSFVQHKIVYDAAVLSF